MAPNDYLIRNVAQELRKNKDFGVGIYAENKHVEEEHGKKLYKTKSGHLNINDILATKPESNTYVPKTSDMCFAFVL